jgi:hypothetical protein
MYIQHNNEAHSHNHFCHGTAIMIKYFELMSVFLPYLSSKKIVYFLYGFVVSSVASLTLSYFSTLS